jgi:hypothetical protein
MGDISSTSFHASKKEVEEVRNLAGGGELALRRVARNDRRIEASNSAAASLVCFSKKAY